MAIRGIIFDMDGVLCDSEPFICEAAGRMFREYGVQAQPEDFRPFVGMGEERFLGGVAEKYGAKLDLAAAKARTYAIYQEIIRGRMQPMNGVGAFLDACRRSPAWWWKTRPSACAPQRRPVARRWACAPASTTPRCARPAHPGRCKIWPRRAACCPEY